MNARDLLFLWLESRLDEASHLWMSEKCSGFSEGVPETYIHLAFSQTVRHIGKSKLMLNEAEQEQAFAFHPGWDLTEWTLDQAVRAALLLSLPGGVNTVDAVMALHQTADMGEHVTLARALFLLPDARLLIHIAREAMRSNMRNVFEAISQRNPYPADFCDDIAWNQMVVKCIFQDLPLHRVHGLKSRNNSELSRILLELVRERNAAGRPITPEVWNCIHHASNEMGTWNPGLKE